MPDRPLRFAIVGCGNISGPYGETAKAYSSVEIVGATDVDPALSAAFVERFGGVDYPSLEALLDDPAVDAVVNLTSHGVHAQVTAAALEAGKHVHSEKPMAGSYAEALSLVELADARGVRLSCSPITFMGDAQETAWGLVDSGAIGNVRVVYAEVNWGRIETWHPRPAPFYAIGPMADVGVYPLTYLTAIFGPARRVSAHGHVVYPDRVTTAGEPFTVGAPDFGVALIELEDGTLVRLTTSFYVGHQSKQRGIEFHGDNGSVFISSWQDFDADVELAPFGGSYEPVPVPGAFHGVDWGKALAELAGAISEQRPHRATGAHAAHVVEILDAVERSIRDGVAVDVSSTFTAPPAPTRRGRSMSTENGPIPWEARPSGSTASLWRSSRNPIIARDHLPRSNSIFNSAVVPFENGFAGVFRIDDKTRTMNIHAGRSVDGIDWEIDEQPIVFRSTDPRVAEIQEVFEHAYDPRVVWIEDRYYVTWCNGYHGPTIGMAYTHDFETFHQLDNAYLPFNRNGVLFPRRIGGRYLMLSRPSDNGHTPFGDIFCSESPDLIHWGRHRRVMGTRDWTWESTKIGAGPIPIETDEGWLVIYHGVLNSCNGFVYSMGAALLDLEEPWRVIARPGDYLLSPQVTYEQVGDVQNVVFPCAALVDRPNDRLTVYYGGADTVVCMAHGHLSELLQFVRS